MTTRRGWHSTEEIALTKLQQNDESMNQIKYKMGITKERGKSYVSRPSRSSAIFRVKSNY